MQTRMYKSVLITRPTSWSPCGGPSLEDPTGAFSAPHSSAQAGWSEGRHEQASPASPHLVCRCLQAPQKAHIPSVPWSLELPVLLPAGKARLGLGCLPCRGHWQTHYFLTVKTTYLNRLPSAQLLSSCNYE